MRTGYPDRMPDAREMSEVPGIFIAMTAAPASTPPAGTRAALATSLREAQVRLSQLVGLAELTDQVTMIERDGRPVAAIVPAAAARTTADARRTADRSAAIAAGWNRRLVDLRDQLTAQHRADRAALSGALRAAWTELDRLSPPGTDRHLDALRAAHRQLAGMLAGDDPAVPRSAA